jgi:hypothetical protein
MIKRAKGALLSSKAAPPPRVRKWSLFCPVHVHLRPVATTRPLHVVISTGQQKKPAQVFGLPSSDLFALLCGQLYFRVLPLLLDLLFLLIRLLL